MAELFTIGELASAFALSPRAIRFYEDQGLLAPERVGTQRVYTKRDRARLQLILRGKRLGFSLAAIREFLDLYDADRTKNRQMAALLDRTRARISELEQQLEDITVTLAELRDMEAEVAAYTAAGAPGQPAPAPASRTQDAKRTDA
ncbi:MAG TPA: MerR family DNA-binding transcriptional regulator [Acetobacteraceae bacterium]